MQLRPIVQLELLYGGALAHVVGAEKERGIRRRARRRRTNSRVDPAKAARPPEALPGKKTDSFHEMGRLVELNQQLLLDFVKKIPTTVEKCNKKFFIFFIFFINDTTPSSTTVEQPWTDMPRPGIEPGPPRWELSTLAKKFPMLLAVLWIRIQLNPDPGLLVNKDPDSDPGFC